MTTRKALALAGSGLALAILSPASALGAAGATNLPFKGTETRTAISNLQPPLHITIEGTGVSTFLGKYTAQSEADVTAITPGDQGLFRLAGTGTGTLVAANGDNLAASGTFHTSDLTPEGHTSWIEGPITPQGSTGRFANATGTLETTCHTGPARLDGVMLVSQSECTTTGQINLHGG